MLSMQRLLQAQHVGIGLCKILHPVLESHLVFASGKRCDSRRPRMPIKPIFVARKWQKAAVAAGIGKVKQYIVQRCLRSCGSNTEAQSALACDRIVAEWARSNQYVLSYPSYLLRRHRQHLVTRRPCSLPAKLDPFVRELQLRR